MADQPITGLPTKTASGVASTDKMLGIDSAEGYQILVREVAKYIIENCDVSTLAGAVRTPKAAIDLLNSKRGDTINIGRNFLAGIITDNGLKIRLLIPYNKNIVSPSIGSAVTSITVTSLGLYSEGNGNQMQISNISSISGYVVKNGIDIEINLTTKPSGITNYTVIGVDFRGTITL